MEIFIHAKYIRIWPYPEVKKLIQQIPEIARFAAGEFMRNSKEFMWNFGYITTSSNSSMRIKASNKFQMYSESRHVKGARRKHYHKQQFEKADQQAIPRVHWTSNSPTPLTQTTSQGQSRHQWAGIMYYADTKCILAVVPTCRCAFLSWASRCRCKSPETGGKDQKNL